MAAPRLQGTMWKRNAGFLRPWRSRPALVTDDGFLQYKKKKSSNGKMKVIDLVTSTISQKIVHSHGYYSFEVQNGQKNFTLGFPEKYEAEMWLEVLLEVADENAAGRRAWVANLRRMLTLTLRERKDLVPEMSERDWVNEWMFCLRSLKNSDMSLSSRRRRLKRLYTIWLQFQLFAELLAEIFFTTVQTRDSGGLATLSSKLSDHTSDIDSDQRSVESSASSSNGHSAVLEKSPRPASRSSNLGDIDELRFKTIRLQFGSKSWRGHKRLEKEVDQFARFRAVMDFVLAEKIVDAKVMEKLPAFPLLSAFSVRGVRVVATAELIRDRSTAVPMDKRDLMELVQALKITKMLRTFPYSELPDILVRKFPGNQERTLIGVSTRYDDVLLQSLRSSLVHGVLIRASSGENDGFELLTAHDMSELVQGKEAHWIPYLDMVYYQLESSAAPGVENWTAKSFLLKAPSSVITGDIVVSIDAEKCRLPLDLKEGFVMKQQVEVHPLVRRLEDVKTNSARINIVSTNGGGSNLLKADAGAALAKNSEQSLKNLFAQYIKGFAAQLVTFGDSPGVPPQLTTSQATSNSSQQRSNLARSNTDPAMFGKSDYVASNGGTEPALRRRRSSVATVGAVMYSGPNTSTTYVIDSIHLREVMRESGVNMRFLPLVFEYVQSARQPGVKTLVASEIVARMAKTLFRYQLFNDQNVSTSHWQSKKERLIKFIDSIMHGIFHDDLPMRRCPIQECVGDQFWNIDAPTLLMLGPFASSAALDYSCIGSGSAIAQYRQVIRGNPSVLFNALLHAFDAQLTKSILPDLHENRFVSMPFLRNEYDLVFRNENGDPRLAMQLQPDLLWSNLQFFQLQFNELKRQSGVANNLSGPRGSERPSDLSDTFAERDSHRSYFADIVEHVRQSLDHSDEFRIETASRNWEEAHAVRSRLVKALRAASVSDESRGIAREYCEEAKEIINGSPSVFPVEYMIALRCLEMVSSTDDHILSGSEGWKEILSLLRFFYRPANQSQFAKSSSSHPLFSIIYFMIHLGGISGTLSPKSTESLRTQIEVNQVQETWLSVIATVDAHCRRTMTKSWTADPINAIATKTASFEFEKSRSLHKQMSTSSLGSNASDDRSDSMNSRGEVKHAQTARAMSTDSALTASAVRQDVLWFVECFLIPSVQTGSWKMSGANFSGVAVNESSSFGNSGLSNNPAPGVALVWGEPFGLSLDEESQIAAAPSESRLANLRSQPSPEHSEVEILKFPSSLRRVVQVSCGYRHTALVTDNRYLYTYGYGECGRLGHGDEESVTSPTAVSFFVSLIETVGANVGGIAQVSCGREHTMAVLVNGELYGFGWAEAGRIGTGDTGSVVFPTKVTAIQGVKSAACGREHTLALTKQGEVFAFGAGFGGRLGNGSESDEEFPVQVTALDGEKIAKIDAGECHSAAVNVKGEVFTWGFGSSGALGDGTRDNSFFPTKIPGPWTEDTHDGDSAVVTSVACGSYHTLVSTSSGKLYGWGDSAAGQLGDEHISSPDMVVLSPKEIQIKSTLEKSQSSAATPGVIREIACGTFTSAVCMEDGRLFMWGSPAAGNGAQLKTEDAEVASVDALKEFSISRIACGAYHSVALTRGLEYC